MLVNQVKQQIESLKREAIEEAERQREQEERDREEEEQARIKREGKRNVYVRPLSRFKTSRLEPFGE